MLRWLEGFLWSPRRDKKDDDLLLPLYDVEMQDEGGGGREGEDEGEDEEVEKEKEKQFLRDIFVAAGGGGNGGSRNLNFYFDMFSTKEHIVKNAEPVVVWWMAHTHPYVKRLMEIRAAVWKQQRRLIFTPYRPRANIYGFPENIVESLVDRCINLLSEYGIVRVQPDEPEEEQRPKEVEPVVPPPEQTSAVEKSPII